MWAEALSQFHGALKLLEEAEGKQGQNVAIILESMGIVFLEHDFASAMPHCERALRIDTSVYGENSKDVASTLQNMGQVFHKQGDFVCAMSHYERALRIFTSVFGPRHYEACSTLAVLLPLLDSAHTVLFADAVQSTMDGCMSALSAARIPSGLVFGRVLQFVRRWGKALLRADRVEDAARWQWDQSERLSAEAKRVSGGVQLVCAPLCWACAPGT